MADDINVPTQLARSSDIVTRLREFCQCDEGEFCTHCEAAHVLDAIDALHASIHPEWVKFSFCEECDQMWPCPTHLLLHPDEADRG